MAYPTIKKLLARGPASNNRYQAIFSGLTAGNKGWATDANQVKRLNEFSEFFISNMSMPGVSYATGDMMGDMAIGVSRKYAHTRMFNEFAMTFILEGGMELYNIFYYWMEQISPREDDLVTSPTAMPRRDIRMNYYDNYVDPKIILKKFERDGSCSLTTEIYNAFPLNISDLGLSSGGQNGLLELTVNFAYETSISYTGGLSTEKSASSNSQTAADAAVPDSQSVGGQWNSDMSLDLSDDISKIYSNSNPYDNKIFAISDRVKFEGAFTTGDSPFFTPSAELNEAMQRSAANLNPNATKAGKSASGGSKGGGSDD